MQNIIFLHKCFFSVFSSTRIKEPPRPHTPCDSFVLIFFTIYILLVKIRTISILQLTGEAREFLGLSRSSPKKGEERSILILTPSPKTSTLNLQLIEEEVIIPFLLLEKGLTWSRSTLQNHCWEFDSLIPCQ